MVNDFHFRGTALGGWLVLEPWITPSLFYQFLGASKKWGDDAPAHVGLDSLTFCSALGPVEANKQLRRHWKSWVTEDQIKNLKATGINSVRIPVGDWMYVPYEPYIGCMDGALEELERGLRLCEKYDIKVVLDIHAMKGSQNGLDNSGDTGNMKWVSTLSTGGAARYRHWDIRGGEWVGRYNQTSAKYETIDYVHLDHSVKVVKELVHRHNLDPIIVGLTPVNEPWWAIPLNVLQDFYWKSHLLIRAEAPHWLTLLHDSFRLSYENWGDFMAKCTHCALDTHIYQAWAWGTTPEWFYEHACKDGDKIREMESYGIPVVVGEWSLATDNCAMWLNGLNDNVPGYPVVECERVQCPLPYMGTDQPGAPPDSTLPAQDPFGTGGESYVIYGTCPRDKPFFDNKQENDRVMHQLAYSKLNAFDQDSHGQFFWNFRTEFEPRWDYQQAVAHGWLPAKYDPVVKQEVAATCNSWIFAQDPNNLTAQQQEALLLFQQQQTLLQSPNGNLNSNTNQNSDNITSNNNDNSVSGNLIFQTLQTPNNDTIYSAAKSSLSVFIVMMSVGALIWVIKMRLYLFSTRRNNNSQKNKNTTTIKYPDTTNNAAATGITANNYHNSSNLTNNYPTDHTLSSPSSLSSLSAEVKRFKNRQYTQLADNERSSV